MHPQDRGKLSDDSKIVNILGYFWNNFGVELFWTCRQVENFEAP